MLMKDDYLGECYLCHRQYSRQGMGRHLTSCLKEQEGEGHKEYYFHLFVEATSIKDYYLHLLMNEESTFYQLDQFLRDIWLECCGHLSSFTISNKEYTDSDRNDFFRVDDSSSLEVPLKDVLYKGLKFSYIYDYGSSTYLTLKVLKRVQRVKGREIQLIARNLPPAILCDNCKKEATNICTECLYVENSHAFLCDDCSEDHPCGEEMLLPVVNSPRCGVCGYCG